MVDIGPNTVNDLRNGLNTVVASARAVRDFETVMARAVDVQRLAEGQGVSWREVRSERLLAQNITETTELRNPQKYELNLIEFEPTQVGLNVVITDRVKRRLDRKAYSVLGVQMQQAMDKKKDQDGLAILDTFTSLGGAGSMMTSGLITAATARIRGNSTETGIGQGALNAVLHPFQIKALEDELKAGIGTYILTPGMTEQVYKQGFAGTISMANVWYAGNIDVDGSDDAKGGVFARNAIVLVEGYSPRREEDRWPWYGGGADVMYMYDEYIYGTRRSEWAYEIYTDASTPTS